MVLGSGMMIKRFPELDVFQPLLKMCRVNSFGMMTVWIAIMSFSSSMILSSLGSETCLGCFGSWAIDEEVDVDVDVDEASLALTTRMLAQIANEFRLNSKGISASPSGDTGVTFAPALLLGVRLHPRGSSRLREISGL